MEETVKARAGKSALMILGQFQYTIDPKGRLAIPAKFRGELKAGLVLCRGFERCIRVYPQDEWKKMADKLLSLPVTQAKSRRLNRMVFSSAFDMEMDGQGRVLLPPPLRDYAGIADTAVIAGLYAGLEIWSPENWEIEAALMQSSMEETLEANI